MSRGIQAFKQTDLTKAIRGTRNAGLEPCRVEISRDGQIVIIIHGPDDASAAGGAVRERMERVEAERRASV